MGAAWTLKQKWNSQVTAEGYNIADTFRKPNNLNPSKKPTETLLEFSEQI